MNTELTNMTKAELRAYIIAHPNDRDAFHTFIDRFSNQTSSEIFPATLTQSELDTIIQQKIQQSQV